MHHNTVTQQRLTEWMSASLYATCMLLGQRSCLQYCTVCATTCAEETWRRTEDCVDSPHPECVNMSEVFPTSSHSACLLNSFAIGACTCHTALQSQVKYLRSTSIEHAAIYVSVSGHLNLHTCVCSAIEECCMSAHCVSESQDLCVLVLVRFHPHPHTYIFIIGKGHGAQIWKNVASINKKMSVKVVKVGSACTSRSTHAMSKEFYHQD